MARNYGARPRMKCRGCGKDVAQSTTTRSERTHKCPHGKECYGKTACLDCHEKMVPRVAIDDADEIPGMGEIIPNGTIPLDER